jgi:hypothetical protein
MANATEEIFGGSVRNEVVRAQNALKDFASFIPKLKKDYLEIFDQLEGCTRKGQASEIMGRVRRDYL